MRLLFGFRDCAVPALRWRSHFYLAAVVNSTEHPYLQGIVPPLITPLLNDDKLDVAALEILVEHLLRGGVHGLFILGTTGEFASLSPRLQRDLIPLAVDLVAGRAPVLVGITSSCLPESIELAKVAAESGAQAVVATTPFYFDISQQELLCYTRRLASTIPLPLVLYNMPQRSGVVFSVETIQALLDLETIVGIKDSSGDVSYFERVVAAGSSRQDFAILMGQEALIERALEMGAHGGVPGSANVFPSLFVKLYEACRGGKHSFIADCRAAIARVHQVLYADYQVSSDGIAPVKFALQQMGIGNGIMASPLASLHDTKAATISAALSKFHQEFGHLLGNNSAVGT